MDERVTLIPSDSEMLGQARAQVRDVLRDCAPYHRMPLAEQKDIYLSLVQENLDRQRDRLGLARPMATDSGKDMGYQGYDPGFGGDTKAFNELVDSVDFPQFVADLLKAVFDANISVMKQQTDAYIKLMKEATKSTADFIKQIKDDESFARLAETRSDRYNVMTERAEDGSTKLSLTDPNGEKVDTEDAEVKRALLEAKINMAKEHRAALRDMIAMGVTRLVVKKGVVEANVEFSVKANRQSKAHHEDQNINTSAVEFGWRPPGFGIFGGSEGNLSVNNTNIQVNTSDKRATDDLSATLKGRVNIEFATDYFRLDNFADMYADGGVAALPQGQKPGQSAPPAR
ncbi:hypothetical protein [Couchioplanes azureus]|uniref:hypothetical protein n=1 Tax=Couchioplanes caeruleus TaxID=56438 RepID=UPI00167007EF|nr:hypothetical protein [Couchioplanes caeruleus]GGQ70055.1 hypothetical protein GCM10010166_44860 [Couchioplanes caeruleus subsp. azureus]